MTKNKKQIEQETDDALKELGVVVADNPEQELWIRVKQNTEQMIKDAENNLLVNREFLKVADTKLSEFKK